MNGLREQIQADLDKPIQRGLRWVSLVGAVYLLARIAVSLWMDAAAPRLVLNLPRGLAALVLLGFFLRLGAERLPPGRLQVFAAAGLGTVLLLPFAQLLALGQASSTADLMLDLVVTGLLLRSRWLYYPALLVPAVAWMVLLAARGVPDALSWQLGVATACMVSLILRHYTGSLIASQAALRFQDLSRRERQGQLIEELEEALGRIRTLKGLLPICSHCKKIRNDQGYWEQVEKYVQERSEAEFTHGICPDCARELLREERERRASKG